MGQSPEKHAEDQLDGVPEPPAQKRKKSEGDVSNMAHLQQD